MIVMIDDDHGDKPATSPKLKLKLDEEVVAIARGVFLYFRATYAKVIQNIGFSYGGMHAHESIDDRPAKVDDERRFLILPSVVVGS